jgi:hypothetical protein
MFSEWTDPYDIDNYFTEIDKQIYSNTTTYQPSTISVRAPPPILSPIASAPNQVGIIQNGAPIQSNFEVEPNSILPADGHTVWTAGPGAPGNYNILMSGPPTKSSFTNHRSILGGMHYDQLNYFNLFLMIIIGVLFSYIIKLNSSINTYQRMIDVLLGKCSDNKLM